MPDDVPGIAIEWASFWDIATPQQGATALEQMCGDEAAAAASYNAEWARADDREEDYRFWIAVLARLQANKDAFF